MSDKTGRIGKFLLPEKEVSLKLIFDNVRNYVIIGAFAAMARWFASGKATAVPGVFTKAPSSDALQVLTASTLTVGVLLFLLNIGQSYQIYVRLLEAVFPTNESNQKRSRTIPWYIYVGYTLAALAFMAVVIVACSMLLTLALYMVWFAATGSSS